MASPSGQDLLISNVVMDISKFLDVQSIVPLSMTCRALRCLLVHDPDGSHPEIKAATFVCSAEHGDAPSSAPSMLVVLLRLHFPWLRRLEVRFRPSAPLAELKGALTRLAEGLGSATELEELFIDVEHLLFFEESATSFCQRFYGVLAKSLANCTKLRRLRASNHLNLFGAQSFYSAGFLRALVPAVEGGANTLEEVTLVLGNQPAILPVDSRDNAAPRDLFGAALRLRRLREFNLQLNLASGPLLNDFLEACEEQHSVSRILPSEALENLSLTCVLYKVPEGVPDPLPAPPSLSPLLSLLGESTKLRSFVVRVSPACWDARGISALGHVLSAKPRLRRLFLDFHRCECKTGKALKCVLDYVRERETCPDNLVQISGLICDDDGGYDEEDELDRYYCREGQKCLTEKNDGLTFKARGCLIRW